MHKAALAVCGLAVAASSASTYWTDVSTDLVPLAVTNGKTMDAELADLDSDGDLDLVLATEYGQNVVLLWDGERFALDPNALPQGKRGDSEDIAVADLNGDGKPDLVFASEDTQGHELYLNAGGGRFTDASERLPWRAPGNAVLAADLDADGDIDLMFGNRGFNTMLSNDGLGAFTDVSDERLPPVDDVTQDLEAADIDGDGDLDVLVANEDANRVLLNDGRGVLVDATEQWYPSIGMEETREIDIGDLNGDGKLDVVCANVGWFAGERAQDRLLLGGEGRFDDATVGNLPRENDFALDADLVDLDGDGDLDIVIAKVAPDLPVPVDVRINDGNARFGTATTRWVPASVVGHGIDVEAADINGDGLVDLYVANHIGPDYVLIADTAGRG